MVNCLSGDDAGFAAGLLSGQAEPDVADIERLDRILAAAYGADPAPPGAFTEAVAKEGGRPVLMALDYSYFLSGRGPRDIPEAVEDSGACEGTARLVPPIPVDDLVPDAPRTASVTDDPAVAEPAIVDDEPLGQVAPPMGGSPAAGPVNDDEVEIESKITDQNGEPWEFAHIPWIPCLDEDGKPAKIPARREWQLTEADDWQVPNYVNDPDMPDDEAYGDIKERYVPGRGRWRADWEEGWVSNIRTGLWPVDVDNPALFESVVADLGLAVPRTWRQETGRAGGGYHLLYDGRDLPEQYWAQGGLGDPGWGDLKANGWVAAAGALHPTGRRYTRNEDWPGQILPPPQWFAEFVMEQREKWRASLSKLGKGSSGRPNVSSIEGENRNVRLCSLRGALFNKVPELDDDEIEQALWAANEEFITPMTDQEMLNTVLRPKPNWERHPDLIRPDCDTAIKTFRVLYDLRESDGKFYARPASTGAPAVVTEVDDALGRTLAAWWEDAAEAWNEMVKNRKDELDEEKKARKAEQDEQKAATLAAMTKDERLEYAKKEQKAALATAPGRPAEEDEEDGYTEVHPARDKINHVLYHLEVAAARHDPVELHLRVVDGRGYVAVDLADQSGSVVLITADGWKITDVRSVPDVPWFRRSGTMLPQVHPVAPEDVPATLDSARQVLGLDAGQWAIALCGLIGAYFPSIARPGWWLSGPSGVGKTTRGEQLAGWIDPVATLGGRINLKRDPRDARAKAMNTFVFTIDNASTITQDESDFWCTMHTGASDQVRKLHSDNTLLSYSYRRIGMGTSLTLPSGFQADALRRMLHVKLAGTDDHPDVERIKAEYDKIKPQVMGAIFTVIAEVLRHLPKALEETLVGVPEMSDFARRLKAADLAYPKLVRASEPGGQDLELYEAYRNHAFEVLVAAGLEDPMAILVIRLMDKQERDGKTKLTMLPAGLLKELRILAGPDIAEKWFPPDATRMGEKLTKLDGPLRRLGIVVERTTRTSHGTPYLITRAKKPLESGAGAAGSGAGNGVSTT